jgi:hypothetical protein
MEHVFVARLICSDQACAAEAEEEALDLGELERLMCDCGCALEVIAWPDWTPEPAEAFVLAQAA